MDVKIGKRLNTIWRVESKYKKKTHTYYLVKNVYNDMELTLCDTTVRKILAGKSQVSKSLRWRIKNDKHNKESV